MSDLNVVAAVETTLEEQESALFLDAVASIEPEVKKSAKKAGRKSKKAAQELSDSEKAERQAANAVAVNEGFSKYASKKAAQKAEEAEEKDPELLGKPFGQKWLVSEETCKRVGIDPALAATPEELAAAGIPSLPELDSFSLPESITSNLEVLIMGADLAADMDQMLAHRTKAFELLNKSKSYNLRDRGRTAHNQAWGFRNTQIREVGRMIFKDLQRKHGHDAKRYEMIKAAFKDLEDSYFASAESPKGQQYLQLCENAMMAAAEAGSPRMLDLYTADCARAKEVLAAFEAVVAEQKAVFEESQIYFALANEIALKHGWETTQAKSTNEGGDAKGKNGKK